MAWNDIHKNLTRPIGMLFQSGRATQVPVVIQAAPSQSANLLEFRGSTGSVLASVSSAGAFSVAANSIGSSELATSTIQYAETSLTAAQVIALDATPVELVAAPGAGNMIEFVSAELFLDHAGTGFAENADNLEIHYENEAGAAVTGVIEMTGFIDQTADTVLHVLPLSPVARAATAVVNKALVLTNINDAFTDAGTTTSVLRVKVAYRVHATGF